MKKVHLAHLGLVLVILTGALAGCANETTAPTGPFDQAALSRVEDVPSLATASVTSLASGLRVRCEARGSSRSKISVDGNNVSPRNGSFRARVRAAGGTVTAAARRAVGDEVEF